MSELFRILQIGRKAITAQQSNMNTIGQNIANVNTRGYSRQRVNLATSPSVLRLNNLLGTGVEVANVERIRDRFIDQLLLQERPNQARFEFLSDSLHFVEEIFNEPSDSGLSSLLEDFFSAFDDLAADPESPAARQVVKERGMALASSFNRVARQLRDLQRELTQELQTRVDEINQKLEAVADLNRKIQRLEGDGAQASELRDKRDLLLDELSQLIDIQTSENDRGIISIASGGKFLLVETTVERLSLQNEAGDVSRPGIVLASSGQPLQPSGGQIQGLLDLRDRMIPSYLSQLDELARTLVQEVNTLHRAGSNPDGQSGFDFFDPDTSGAEDLAVSPAILDEPGLMASAGSAATPGDNSTALAIAELRTRPVLQGGTVTLVDYYTSLVSGIGAQTQEAENMKENLSLVVRQLEARRESVSGVSLDEEMVNMIAAQNAFNAATRFVATVDEMTQAVLNML